MTFAGRQFLNLLAGLLTALSVGGLCGFVSSEARASVLAPESLADLIGDFELNADPSAGASTESGPMVPADQPLPGDRDDSDRFLVPGLPVDGSSAGTSTSSFGLGTGGASSAVLHAAASLSDPDQSLTTWLQGEARFALPIPPGNDLLRPPQES